MLRLFTGTHPKAVQDWLPKAAGIFPADPNHRLIPREKKHRLMLKLEKIVWPAVQQKALPAGALELIKLPSDVGLNLVCNGWIFREWPWPAVRR